MLSKRMLPRPDRLRRIRSRFSWLDQRLVRDGHLRELSSRAGMLYLFLVTVSDCHGVSWYSARRICLETGMSFEELAAARCELVVRDLIGFEDGLYQVLDLSDPVNRESRPAAAGITAGSERPASCEEVSALLAEFQENRGI